MEGLLEASARVSTPFERAGGLLVADPKLIVGDCEQVSDRHDRVRSALVVEMTVPPGLREQLLVEVLVRLGPVCARPGRVSLPLSWQARGWPRLFPTFDGSLDAAADADGTVLSLRGTYSVPLGPLGRFGDGLAGRRLARHAGSSFLEQAARRVEGQPPYRPDLARWRPLAYAVHLEEVIATQQWRRNQ